MVDWKWKWDHDRQTDRQTDDMAIYRYCLSPPQRKNLIFSMVSTLLLKCDSEAQTTRSFVFDASEVTECLITDDVGLIIQSSGSAAGRR